MSYKLYYFDMRGRAELIRMIFAAAGVPFQDVRFSREEWVAKYKAIAPTGVAPFLEDPVTGKTLVQSNPIATLLAKRLKLMSNDPLECYYVDRLMYQITDFVDDAIAPVLYGPEDRRPAAMQEFLETKGRRHLSNLVKLMRESASPGSHFAVGSSLSLADLAIHNLLDYVDCMGPGAQSLMAEYPELVAHRKHALQSNKSLAKYLAGRKGF